MFTFMQWLEETEATVGYTCLLLKWADNVSCFSMVVFW